LTLIYLNFVTVSRLERNPTIKTKSEHAALTAAFPLAFCAIQLPKQPISPPSRQLSYLLVRTKLR